MKSTDVVNLSKVLYGSPAASDKVVQHNKHIEFGFYHSLYFWLCGTECNPDVTCTSILGKLPNIIIFYNKQNLFLKS